MDGKANIEKGENSQLHKSDIEIKWHIILRVFALLCAAYMLFPAPFKRLSVDLDPSWIYAINQAGALGLKFGKDIIFTYGPLGYLLQPINIGYNALAGACFWATIYFFTMYAISDILFFNKNIANRISNFGVLFLLFACLFAPPDREYYVCYLVILWLSILWFDQNRVRYLVPLSFVVSLCFFMKFSSAVFTISAILVFVVVSSIRERRLNKASSYLLLSIPIMVIIGYLIYNPSLVDLYHYVLGGFEISSGFNSAMSLNLNTGYLVQALTLGVIFAFALLLMSRLDTNFFMYMCIYAGPMFFIFKHGFVRSDLHTEAFYRNFTLYICTMILFFDIVGFLKNGAAVADSVVQPSVASSNEWSKVKRMMLPLLVIALLYAPIANYGNPLPKIARSIAGKNAELKESYITLKEGTVFLEASTVPNEIKEAIGKSSLSIFSWEYLLMDSLDAEWKMLPVIQNYSAYTPYLDKLESRLYSEEGPEYVLIDFNSLTIDLRYPFIETPSTWEAIYASYRTSMVQDNYLLLERTERAFNTNNKNVINEAISPKEEKIVIPESSQMTCIRIEAELTLLGKMMKTFVKIPEVTMDVVYEDGTTAEGRVLLDNFENDVLIGCLPRTIDETAEMLNPVGKTRNADKEVAAVESIQFGGPGLRYYHPSVNVAISEYVDTKAE